MGVTLNYQRDTLRYDYFVPESKEHGAKLELRTYQWLVEQYTKPSDTILDPMSGIGTVHFAATIGRNTVGIEIAERFAEIQRMNIDKLRQTLGFTGSVHLLEGDCRMFLPWPPQIGDDSLPKTIDAIITSPPYSDVEKAGQSYGFINPTTGQTMAVGTLGYSEQWANVGNITVYPLYLDAMRHIYVACNRSLKVGAPLISITKDRVKGGERVYISKDNVRMAMEAGFLLEDWHIRYAGESIRTVVPRRRREESGTDRPELTVLNEDLLVLRKVRDV